MTFTADVIQGALDNVLAILTTIAASLGTAAVIIKKIQERSKAIAALIKGNEEALEEIKKTDPELYFRSKGKIKSRIDIEGVSDIVNPMVKEICHGDGKPHTKPFIKIPSFNSETNGITRDNANQDIGRKNNDVQDDAA